VFGIGADLDEATWRDVFRQLVALGLVQVEHAAYGALRLTDASRPVLKGERTVEMRRTAPRVRKGRKSRLASASAAATSVDAESGAAATSGETAGEAARLASLKAWRLAESRRQALPAYVILHDATLAEIARRCPADLDALAGIPGIGARKLERYGPALLALLAEG
jgi:ATP-dependent DNA helicase RecQ